jgi:Cu/Ag efflux pump CusA
MKIAIPFTLLSIFLPPYLNFHRVTETPIVMLSVPFALVGGMVSSTVLALAVIPAVDALAKQWRSKQGLEG